MLQIRDVTRRFGGNTAVSNVKLEIPQGQMVGVIGRSGAGKSTLLRMINRLTDPSDGIHRLRRHATSRRCAGGAARLAARLRHDLPAVQPRAAPRRADQRDARPAQRPSTPCSICSASSRAEERLDGARGAGAARHRADRPAAGRTLSGGQQQRVAIARALMQQPEGRSSPTSRSPRSTPQCQDRHGLACATSTPATASPSSPTCTRSIRRAPIASRIIGMAAGKVVFDGAPDELTTRCRARDLRRRHDGSEISEAITSTSIDVPKPRKRETRAGPRTGLRRLLTVRRPALSPTKPRRMPANRRDHHVQERTLTAPSRSAR